MTLINRLLVYAIGSCSLLFLVACSGGESRIAFIGQTEISTMNPDGTDVIQITSNQSEKVTANWSKDGSKVVFDNMVSDDMEIFIMKSDGTEVAQLTSNAA